MISQPFRVWKETTAPPRIWKGKHVAGFCDSAVFQIWETVFLFEI